MSTTGFKLSDGTDLIELFETYTTGTQAALTGFKNSIGVDLNTVFARNTTGTYIANNTSYIAQPGQDLRLLFEPIKPLTITGTGTYTTSIIGTTYTYTFTVGTNNITIKKPITTLYAIVAGGGSGGALGTYSASAPGGGGGGFGFIAISNPAINQQYNTTVGSNVNYGYPGNNSTFYDLGGNGVRGNGGGYTAAANTQPPGGTCVTVGTLAGAGALTARSGGNGGAGDSAGSNNPGSNSSGSITVLGITYNYGGGGAAGGAARSSNGGRSGVNGIGGVGPYVNNGWGETSITGAGGGGGGGRKGDGATSSSPGGGGQGRRGEIIVTFVYP